MAVVGHLMEFANDPGPYPIVTVRELDNGGRASSLATCSR